MSPPDPTAAVQADQERTALADQPALLFFGLLLLVQVTLAAALQLASVPFGLAFTELFLFAGLAVLAARAANWRARSLLQLRPVPARLVLLGALVGLANFGVAGGMQAAARALFPLDLAKQFDAAHLFQDATGFELGALVVALGLFAPVCEEVAFRGYLQTVLRARYRDGAAVVVTAVLFALLHLDPVGMAARVELGVVFGVLALWSRSLLPAIAAHAANNLVASSLLLYVLGRPPNPAAGAPGQELQHGLILGLGGLVSLAGMLAIFRASARAHAPAPAPLELLGQGEGHDVRLFRVQRELALWGAAGLVCAAAFLIPYRRSAEINFIDAWHPVQALKGRLPDEPSRKAFQERMRAERRRAREGALDLDAYRKLRERLGALNKACKDAPPTPGQIDQALQIDRALGQE